MDVADRTETGPPQKLNFPECLYSIVPESRYLAELGEYHTYGIQMITPKCIDILHDVSVCKKTVEHIVEFLNHYKVSSIHIYDVVMDMLP